MGNQKSGPEEAVKGAVEGIPCAGGVDSVDAGRGNSFAPLMANWINSRAVAFALPFNL